MKNGTKRITTIACALMLVGALLFGTAYALGARPLNILENNMLAFSFPWPFSSAGMGYRDWQNAFSANGSYEADASGITGISIDWIAGSVDVRPGDGDAIAFSEGAVVEEKALKYGVEDGILYIQYCGNGPMLGLNDKKSLTVRLPSALAENMASFTADVTSAIATVSGVSAERFRLEGISGDLNASDITAGAVEIGSTSGAVRFVGVYDSLSADSISGLIEIESRGAAKATSAESTSGQIRLSGDCGALSASTISGLVTVSEAAAKSVNVETSSGAVQLTLDAVPNPINISTISGSVSLALPADGGFTIGYDTISGELQCDFSVVMSGGRYVCGDGAANLNVETTSGSLSVTPR